MKYSAKFKLEAIRYANETNNCAAGRKYGISKKLVRDWKKNVEVIEMPKKILLTGESSLHFLF